MTQKKSVNPLLAAKMGSKNDKNSGNEEINNSMNKEAPNFIKKRASGANNNTNSLDILKNKFEEKNKLDDREYTTIHIRSTKDINDSISMICKEEKISKGEFLERAVNIYIKDDRLFKMSKLELLSDVLDKN